MRSLQTMQPNGNCAVSSIRRTNVRQSNPNLTLPHDPQGLLSMPTHSADSQFNRDFISGHGRLTLSLDEQIKALESKLDTLELKAKG